MKGHFEIEELEYIESYGAIEQDVMTHHDLHCACENSYFHGMESIIFIMVFILYFSMTSKRSDFIC